MRTRSFPATLMFFVLCLAPSEVEASPVADSLVSSGVEASLNRPLPLLN